MNTTTFVKEQNIQKIRDILSKEKSISKSDIASRAGLSFPTVTRLLNGLCTGGEVLELTERDSTGGRSASLYCLNKNYTYYLLIAVEGNWIKWSIRNLEKEIIDMDKVDHSSMGVLPKLDSLIVELEKKYSNIKSISIGLAAMVNNGMVKEGIWDGLQGIDLPLHFSNLTRTPIIVENDMHIVALGQWYSSTYKTTASVCIYLGENCWFGAGLVLNGEVWKGSNGLAGELGLMSGFDHLKERNAKSLSKEEIEEAYSIIIQGYSALLNPEQIILYQNQYLEGGIDKIRKVCFKRLPEEILPNIELSDEFEKHYELGLFQLAYNHGKKQQEDNYEV